MSGPRVRIHDDGHRLHLRWWAEGDEWREILEDFKADFTRWERRYDPLTRRWSVPRDCRSRLREWADYWFDPPNQEWDDGEPAGRTYGQSYGYGESSYGGQAGHTSTGTGTLEAAFKELHLLPTAPAWAAEAVFKAACRVHHPDVGGDGQTMTRINLAMELIRASQQERRAS